MKKGVIISKADTFTVDVTTAEQSLETTYRKQISSLYTIGGHSCLNFPQVCCNLHAFTRGKIFQFTDYKLMQDVTKMLLTKCISK
jgi:hypothetical protein